MSARDSFDRIYRALTILEQCFDENRGTVNLTYKEMMYIYLIDFTDGCTVSKLAETIGVSLPAVTKRINSLEERGFVTRTRSEGDGRVKTIGLSDKGREEARAAGRLMRDEGLDFDVCYTSFLKRAIHTLNLALEEMDREWLPVVKAWQLNERHYGALQGLNKAETAQKFGEDQVKIWRRSYATPPPELSPEDPRNPANQEMFRTVPKGSLPLTESLRETVARAVPYFDEEIKPRMLAGERVLIAAHGNSLRALVKVFDGMSEDEIVGVNIPTGVPLVYEFDRDFNVVSKRYLGDQDAVAAKMNAVANQGKSK